MRAAVFIRYHSGDGFGHVGWAFETGDGRVNAGSVENHSGHLFTPADHMGFWNGAFEDPLVPIREHGYDDVKWIDVADADPALAYRTVLWIKNEAYKALHRNCEDDAYDVLRAFGVDHLALPSIIWFPKSWFRRFRGRLEHLDEFSWPLAFARGPSIPQDDTGLPQDDTGLPQDDTGLPQDDTGLPQDTGRPQDDTGIPHHDTEPWQPTWRRPWHPHFHALKAHRLTLLIPWA